MNVLSIVRARWPAVAPPPLNLSSEIYSLTLYNAPSTGTSFALKLTPSPILWLLRESRAPEVARNSSLTNEFRTVLACSKSVVNSFDVNVVFSNCLEIFSRISSAAVTFGLSVVISDFFTYFWRSSFTVSRECLISVTVLGVTTVSSLTFLGAPSLGIEDKTKTFSLSFLAMVSISACVNSLLFNAFLAFSKSAWIAARVEAGAFSLLTLAKSSWTFVILACNWDLSNLCFSATLSALASLVTVIVLVDVPLFRELASTASLFSDGFSLSSVSLATSTFSVSLVSSFFDVRAGSIRGGFSSFGFGAPMVGWFLPSTTSALTACVPKNISAATATEAAPKLYLRIEYLKTLSLWWRLIRLNDLFLCSMFPPKGNLI